MNTTDVWTGTSADGAGFQDEMEQGIAAAQAGDKEGAHKLFQAVAARNAHRPDVWVWLGGTSPTLDEAEAAFQRAVMLDPSHEEGNLGLRWVALRKQATGRAGSDLSTGAFDRSAATGLPTDTLASGGLNSTDLSTGSLTNADSSKAVKTKTSKAGGRLDKIPMAARVFFLLSIILYAIVVYIVWIGPWLAHG